MLSTERIRTMTKLNRYEEGPDSEYLKINHMYRSDYIGMALLRNFFCVTIGYILLLGIAGLYHFEFLASKWFELNLRTVVISIIAGYVILLALYSSIVYIICSLRYRRAEKYAKEYEDELQNLEEQYLYSEKVNEEYQNDRKELL